MKNKVRTAGLSTCPQTCCESPCDEMLRLQQRERECPTKKAAEVVALVRCFQECCDALGVSRETTSPRQLVAEVKKVTHNATHDGRRIRRTVDGIVGSLEDGQ